jgi:glycosyltransferase involved in cell wall biosynthesis
MFSAMRFVQFTPGAGGMLCGNCLRDNALVAALCRMGHDAVMVPLYLPMTLDEADQSAPQSVLFGGINVYLDQVFPLFHRAPQWMRRALASRWMLRAAGRHAAKTRPQDVADITLSMLRGEQGNQSAELSGLTAWIESQPKPDMTCLSNGLLAGLARTIKTATHAPLICMLHGEDLFLDQLPDPKRAGAWRLMKERLADADWLVAPSRYYAGAMERRLDLPPGRIRVAHNGIDLSGYDIGNAGEKPAGTAMPVIGFFARMCREKGIDLLVDAFVELRRRNRIRARLHMGGSCGPADQPVVAEMRRKLEAAGLMEDAAFFPNLDRAGKIAFLKSLSVLSVPTRYGEAFGLYVIEAMAAGVPVVLPRRGAFPEIIGSTGGGMLYNPQDSSGLADALEAMLGDSGQARRMGQSGREVVFRDFSAGAMAARMLEIPGTRELDPGMKNG